MRSVISSCVWNGPSAWKNPKTYLHSISKQTYLSYFATGQCTPLSRSRSRSLCLSLVPAELGEATQNLNMFDILSDCMVECDTVHAKRLSGVLLSSDASHTGGDEAVLPCIMLRTEPFGKWIMKAEASEDWESLPTCPSLTPQLETSFC